MQAPSPRPLLRLVTLIAVASLIAVACGGPDIADSIVLPEGFTPTTAPNEASDPSESAAVEAAATPTTISPGASAPTTTPATPTTTPAAPTTGTEPPAPIAPDVTVPAAVSESGRSPAYGGGNPTTPLVEALSVSMSTVDGDTIDVSQYLGRDVVLWFWAPWCSWCNAEAPRINAVTADYGDDVEIVGVAGVSDRESMQSFVERHDLGHLTHLADLDGHFWQSLDITYQPWWMFINDTGEVVLNWQGRLSEDEVAEVMDILIAA